MGKQYCKCGIVMCGIFLLLCSFQKDESESLNSNKIYLPSPATHPWTVAKTKNCLRQMKLD